MFTQHQPMDNTKGTQNIEGEAMHDFDISLSDDNTVFFTSPQNENFAISEESFHCEESFCNNDLYLTTLKHMWKVITHVLQQAKNVVVYP
jgi:hypothetical protein